jgi:hypothetical protein
MGFEPVYCPSSEGTILYIQQLVYLMLLCWLAASRIGVELIQVLNMSSLSVKHTVKYNHSLPAHAVVVFLHQSLWEYLSSFPVLCKVHFHDATKINQHPQLSHNQALEFLSLLLHMFLSLSENYFHSPLLFCSACGQVADWATLVQWQCW